MLYQFNHRTNGVFTVSGSFATNGGGAIDTTTIRGRGFTAVRSGVGIFTVTLTNRVAEMISGSAALQTSAPTTSSGVLAAVTITNGVLVATINTITSGALADQAANSTNRVHFDFHVRGSLRPS